MVTCFDRDYIGRPQICSKPPPWMVKVHDISFMFIFYLDCLSFDQENFFCICAVDVQVDGCDIVALARGSTLDNLVCFVMIVAIHSYWF